MRFHDGGLPGKARRGRHAGWPAPSRNQPDPVYRRPGIRLCPDG
ncbi:hypothetical protein BRI9_0509 [plant metagenome]